MDKNSQQPLKKPLVDLQFSRAEPAGKPSQKTDLYTPPFHQELLLHITSMGFSYPKHTENFNNQNLNSRLTQVNFGLELELHEVFRSHTQSSLTFKGKTTQATKKRKIKRDKEKNNPPTNKITLNHQRNPPNDCWTGRNQRTAPHLSKKMFPLQSSKL